MDVSKIWYILNEAVRGKIPVYKIARACEGLPDETIYELADKMEADIHIEPNSYIKTAKQIKFRNEINKINKELNYERFNRNETK